MHIYINQAQLNIKLAFIFQKKFSIWIPMDTNWKIPHLNLNCTEKWTSGTSSIQFKTVRVQVVTATGGYFLRSWGSQVQPRFRRYNTEQSVPRGSHNFIQVLCTKQWARSVSAVQYSPPSVKLALGPARETLSVASSWNFRSITKNYPFYFWFRIFFYRILSPLLLHGFISKQQIK
jgi:hypothetical protein